MGKVALHDVPATVTLVSKSPNVPVWVDPSRKNGASSRRKSLRVTDQPS